MRRAEGAGSRVKHCGNRGTLEIMRPLNGVRKSDGDFKLSEHHLRHCARLCLPRHPANCFR